MRQEGALRVRAFGLGRTKEEAGELLQTRRAYSRSTRALRPLPLSRPRPAADRGAARGATPRRAWCCCSAGPACSGVTCVTTPRASRTSPTSSSPTSSPTSGGARRWPGQLPRALALRGLRPVRGRALGARARGEERFQTCWRASARWACRHDARARSTSATALGHLKGDPQAYRAIVYDKAAYVLHMLRGVVGDAAFFRGLLAFRTSTATERRRTEDLGGPGSGLREGPRGLLPGLGASSTGLPRSYL